MNIRFQFLFWLAVAALFALFLYLFRAILPPFIAGIVIAYLLNPVVEKLTQYKLSRTLATIAILLVFFITIMLLLVLIAPPLYRELAELADNIPAYVDILSERWHSLIIAMGGESDLESLDTGLQQLIRDNFSNALNVSANVVAALIGGGRAAASLLSLLVVTPLVAFFMMIEWPRIVGWIDDLLPRNSRKQIRELLEDIDRKIAGFVRGQLIVALILGILYALVLSLLDLEFGFLIGLTAGVLSIIPLFGSVVGLVIGSLTAWFQTGDILFVGTVLAVFLVGQFIEGNFITPKLLSGSVGLHPLWILFSLLAGSALFGVLGMMVAVPVAATVGVLVNFALENYKSSSYYKA